MNEVRRMIAAADTAAGPTYLATVVAVDGSAYRRPGARMLILPDSERIGTISGGCLERDLCHSAPWLAQDGPHLVSFDTRSEPDDPNPRYNLGCSGVIHVLVERLSGDAHCPLEPLRTVMTSGRARVVATVFAREGTGFPPPGTRLTVEQMTACFGELPAGAQAVGDDGRPINAEVRDGDNACRLLIERIDPPRPLWVFGAGDDAQPLSAMADQLGWDVTIVDKRAHMATAARFPTARQRVCVDPHDAPAQLAASSHTAAILMTHDFAADAALLPWLLASEAGYIGLLGPKLRTAKLMKTLRDEGRLPRLDQLDRLHTPVGLDLGGSTAAEIALSVLAEIVAVDNHRGGGRLHQRQGAIHEATPTVTVDLSDHSRTAVGA